MLSIAACLSQPCLSSSRLKECRHTYSALAHTSLRRLITPQLTLLPSSTADIMVASAENAVDYAAMGPTSRGGVRGLQTSMGMSVVGMSVVGMSWWASLQLHGVVGHDSDSGGCLAWKSVDQLNPHFSSNVQHSQPWHNLPLSSLRARSTAPGPRLARASCHAQPSLARL